MRVARSGNFRRGLVLLAAAGTIGSAGLAVAPTATAAAVLPSAGAAHTAEPPGPGSHPVPAPASGQAAAKADRRDPASPPVGGAPPPSVALPSGAWEPLGPSPVGTSPATAYSGRVTSMVRISSGTHSGRLVIGSAGGGIWTSDNNGTNWTSRTDTATNLAIGSLAIDPSDANHLIAGTGEGNNSGDSSAGNGVLTSSDGGTTWSLQNPSGVFTNLHIEQVAIDPSNANHQFAATDAGLYVTTNGGTTWALPSDPSYSSLYNVTTSVVIDPTTPTVVYIGTRSGFVGKSVDGGVTWAQASSGITGSSVYLVALTLDPSTPTTLYASIGGTGPVKLYKSTNSAGTWTQLSGAPDYTGLPYYYGSGSGDQGWYDNVIAVDPTNSNHLVAGGIALAQSTDGGVTWSKINIIHPDQHALAFTAAGDLWIGCDGGVFHYTPPSTFTDNNGDLNITQFYGGFNVVGTSILAGSQDNGTVLGSTNSQAAWPFVLGGDGGASAITPNHPSLQFAEATGHLYRTTDAWATTTTYISPFAAEEDDGGEDPVDADGSGEFIPPMIVVPNSATPDSPTVLMGGSDLYRTTNPSAASPTWTQVTSVGTNVTAIAASPTDPQVVYVGFHNGTVEVSTNNGVSFTPLASESRSENYVTGISVDPTNSHAITVSFSYNATRYDAGFAHVEQYSFSTTPASGTWTTISGSGLPSAVSRVVYDDGNLLAATDSGVYATGVVNGASTVWSRVGSGLPFVQVQDAFVADDGTVYIVTHGRGAWKLPPPAAPVTHVSSDFDGDGRSDVAVYRPGSAGHWYVEESGGGSVNTGFGTTGDIPVPGDYDGDGETDIAVFRPSTGKWYVKTSSGTSQTVGWGTSTDIPVPGDYDGDGETDLAVFRPSTGKWLIKNSSGGTQTIGWGTSTDIPIPGDYDGDNVTDAAVFRPTAGKWLIKGSDGTNTTVGWGISTDIPVPADYDGDGKADLAVFRPSSGKWYVIYSGSSPTTATVGFGTSGDIPVPADFNGDGSADIAVFRPSNHRWYVYGGNTTSFGTSGDIPLEVPPAVYLHSFG